MSASGPGSKQPGPNTPATNGLALSDPLNTRSGWLTHNVNSLGGATNNTSPSFLTPLGFDFNGVVFSEDHRMFVRLPRVRELYSEPGCHHLDLDGPAHVCGAVGGPALRADRQRAVGLYHDGHGGGAGS